MLNQHAIEKVENFVHEQKHTQKKELPATINAPSMLPRKISRTLYITSGRRGNRGGESRGRPLAIVFL